MRSLSIQRTLVSQYPRSHRELRFGAFDNTLAVSEDGKYYRHKEKAIAIELLENEIITIWKPYDDVTIRTRLLIDHPWHARIHDIVTSRKLQVAEGGFALGIEGDGELKRIYTEEKNHADYEGVVYSDEDYSGIRSVKGFMDGLLLPAISNTNLMNPKTIIPTLKASLEPGTHQLISLVCGDCYGYETMEEPTELIKRIQQAIEK